MGNSCLSNITYGQKQYFVISGSQSIGGLQSILCYNFLCLLQINCFSIDLILSYSTNKIKYPSYSKLHVLLIPIFYLFLTLQFFHCCFTAMYILYIAHKKLS